MVNPALIYKLRSLGENTSLEKENIENYKEMTYYHGIYSTKTYPAFIFF